MKQARISLVFGWVRTMPLALVVLVTDPFAVLAQSAPDLTAIQTESSRVTDAPPPSYGSGYPDSASAPIAYPPAPAHPVVPVGYPAYPPAPYAAYPVSNPAPTAAVPGSTAGMSVQVSTTVSVPTQAVPGSVPVTSYSPAPVPSQPSAYPPPITVSYPAYGQTPAGYAVPTSGSYPYSAASPQIYAGPEAQLPLPSTITVGTGSPGSPDSALWLPKLLEVYRLYQSGQVQQAEQLYQQVRALVGTNAHSALSEPFSTPESLPLEAQFIWQQVTDADATQPSRRLLQALQLLVNQYPQFIPGYTRLAQALEWNGRPVDGLTVLEQAIARYPDQAEVARARVQALSRASRLSDAATAALEFVMKNPHSPYVSEFKALAETMLQQSQVRERQQQPRNAFLGRLLKGGFNFLFTGGVAGPLGTIQDLLRLLR